VHRSPLTEIVPLFGTDGEFVADAIVPIQPGPRADVVVWRGRYFRSHSNGFYVESAPVIDDTSPILYAANA
jgi:hypothetical protein